MDIQDFLKQLKNYGIVNRIPNISESTAQTIQDILIKRQVINMLEIGSANGYSTLQFANCIKSWGGKITSIEFAQNAYEAAKSNFDTAGLPNIELIFGDALQVIPGLNQEFDCIFIDGVKKLTLDFYLCAIQKIKKGGVIIVDDVVKFRYKMENFYAHLAKENISYEIIMSDPDDGIMILEY